ncbi:MAG: hypothetical protein A3F16_07640 [Deltaproteobacteria bacterium RIFCSPHIGHO2_12_FULL_43_9]|nr:MAG: hypothetical protein A3F16_07640 [Deltaproteobacteria bacterium RIFCSPHIGHO2_12_FULL_43_9]
MSDKKIIKRIFSKMGIISDPLKKWHVYLKPTFFLIIGAIFLLIIISLLGVVKYSTSPHFCNSCHIMEPYYNAWKTSKHQTVACVECHYPPGKAKTILWKKFQAVSQVVKYVTRTYSSKPYAEVEDASCLRSGCHSTRLLQGRVVSERGIKFDHKSHVGQTRRDRQLRCVSCHSQIVVGRHVEVTYDTCYLCHFKISGKGPTPTPIGGCLGCHELPTQDFKMANMTYNHKNFVTKQGIACRDCHLDVVRGDGHVAQERCFTCHNEPEKLARFTEGPFLHVNHVTKHNVACFHCHEVMQHGFSQPGETSLGKIEVPSATIDATDQDARKHMASLTFECSYCHESKHAGQLLMYTGKVSSLNLPEIPSPMFTANVDCVGCHYLEKFAPNDIEFLGKTSPASPEACVKCHGASFKGIWEETKVELKEALAKLDNKLKAVQAGMKNSQLSREDRKKWEPKVKEADHLLHFVRDGRGEHNIYLASVALRRIDGALSETADKLKIAAPNLSALPLLSGSYCATMCHSKVGVKVPPETVTAFGKKMPHTFHTGMMGCVNCHNIEGHKNVPLKNDVKQLCANCHMK